MIKRIPIASSTFTQNSIALECALYLSICAHCIYIATHISLFAYYTTLSHCMYRAPSRIVILYDSMVRCGDTQCAHASTALTNSLRAYQYCLFLIDINYLALAAVVGASFLLSDSFFGSGFLSLEGEAVDLTISGRAWTALR